MTLKKRASLMTVAALLAVAALNVDLIAQTGRMITTTGVVYVRAITGTLVATAYRATYYVVGTEDTSGCRIDVSSGVLRIREGDNSDYCDAAALTFTATGNITAGNDGFIGPSAYLTNALYFGTAGSKGNILVATNGQYTFRNGANSNTYDITLADWGTTLSAEAVSVADTAVLAGPASSVGRLSIAIGTDNRICEFELTGTNAPVELIDGGTFCSITKDTATSINVYYESSAYRIQNLRGGTRALRIVLIGG